MIRLRPVLALTAAALLALPAAALAQTAGPAQNAGDQQYTDPLAPSQPNGDSGGSGSPAPSAPPTAPTTPETAQSGSEAPEAAQAAPAQNELPRTGFPAGIAALAGGAMLGAGALLRRRLT